MRTRVRWLAVLASRPEMRPMGNQESLSNSHTAVHP